MRNAIIFLLLLLLSLNGALAWQSRQTEGSTAVPEGETRCSLVSPAAERVPLLLPNTMVLIKSIHLPK